MSKESVLNKASSTAGAFLGALAVIFLLVAIITAAALVNGLVIKVMWGWFLVPLGLPVLGFAHAIGLGFFVRYLTWQHTPNNKDESDTETHARRLLLAFLYPFIVLGLGFIAHCFM